MPTSCDKTPTNNTQNVKKFTTHQKYFHYNNKNNNIMYVHSSITAMDTTYVVDANA